MERRREKEVEGRGYVCKSKLLIADAPSHHEPARPLVGRRGPGLIDNAPRERCRVGGGRGRGCPAGGRGRPKMAAEPAGARSRD